jgi:hypothetical protein
VSVTRAVDLALDDDAVAVVAVVVRDEECEDSRDEEEDDVPGYHVRNHSIAKFAQELT